MGNTKGTSMGKKILFFLIVLSLGFYGGYKFFAPTSEVEWSKTHYIEEVILVQHY